MSVEHIHSAKFPRKPHNTPAVKVPGLVFCAGQTAGGEIKEATRTCSQNLKEVSESSGSSSEKVVKYNVYLADMDRDFGPLNEAYVDFSKTNSSTPPPSRTCIQAGKSPGAGIIVEIECIAAA